MKKKSVLFLLIILISSCTPQVPSSTLTPVVAATSSLTPTITQTLQPTFTATATLTPCPASGQLTVGEMQIFFHEADITSDDCQFFATYVEKFNEWATTNEFSVKDGQVHIFTSPEAATDFEYEWGRKIGCNLDKENTYQAWVRGGAQFLIGASFFMVTGWWDEKENIKSERAVALAHELTHIIQGNYAGSCQRFWQTPDWFQEGQAQYFSHLIVSSWGITPDDSRANLLKCEYTLRQLVSGQDCVYMQGEQALILLREKYGEKSMNVYMGIAGGKSFDQAFYDVYNTSVSAFSDEFDKYRGNGYSLNLVTPTPSTMGSINGRVVLTANYSTLNLSEYNLTFCRIGGTQCLGGPPLEANGEFSMFLLPGFYKISFGPWDGGQALGWYSVNGIVSEITCGSGVYVDDLMIVNIDFKVASPVPCSSLSSSSTGLGISGKIILDPSYPNQDLSKYYLKFCANHPKCLETSIQSDGTFVQLLDSGTYIISLNLRDDDSLIGWYSKIGLVDKVVCADSIRIINEMAFIDFNVLTPISCP